MAKGKVTRRIGSILKAKGMSKAEFARRTGIKEQTVQSWFRDQGSPKADCVVQVANTLEISLNFLFGVRQEKNLDLKTALSKECLLIYMEKHKMKTKHPNYRILTKGTTSKVAPVDVRGWERMVELVAWLKPRLRNSQPK